MARRRRRPSTLPTALQQSQPSAPAKFRLEPLVQHPVSAGDAPVDLLFHSTRGRRPFPPGPPLPPAPACALPAARRADECRTADSLWPCHSIPPIVVADLHRKAMAVTKPVATGQQRYPPSKSGIAGLSARLWVRRRCRCYSPDRPAVLLLLQP